MNKAEYLRVLEESNQATRVFSVAQRAYRARTIGDAEFLAARDIHDAACLAFEQAYAAYVNTNPSEE